MLSRNEIRERAVKFSKEWENDFNEDAEAKSFMDGFFEVFGISRRRVASFETHVKKEDGRQGFIDLLWKGVILIEFKSRGKNLDKAHTQAKDYFPGLKDAELPKYILVSDFARFRLYDLEEGTVTEFPLQDLVKNIDLFGFISGYQKQVYKEQDPVNVKAAELMGRLHDRLEQIGYEGHDLEVYLVRILFCLFAEDTTIFNRQQFQDYIEQRTGVDGADLAPRLQELFQVLNTPNEKRFKNLDEQLNEFPYVNGKLFEEPLRIASFDAKMRQALLDCCYLDWSKISPAIFGSMFQSVMNPQERRNLGAHYTSEKNILKLIKPLFLDDLWKEFESVKTNKNKLTEFHKKLSKMKFLDPACGCGNFLIITYRELRMLELEILRALNKSGQGFLNVGDIIWLDVDMMYGIEYEEFPARIAEVAMWLMDHQMNMLISNEFGQYFARLPLKKAATIVHGNALRIDWEEVIPKDKLSFIIGNPPFIGERYQTDEQRKDLEFVYECKVVLDYVTGWYIKAARFIQGTDIRVALVSTNSIVQGEQVGTFWNPMFNKFNIILHFAHRTFKWTNEAKGNAAVYCVIIGFANFDIPVKTLYEYENIKGDPIEVRAKHINGYLIDGKDAVIQKRGKPICESPNMIRGNYPFDYGNLIFTADEKDEFVKREPISKPWFKILLGGTELLNNQNRYCLWLKDIQPNELKKMPYVLERVKKVKEARLNVADKGTQKLANRPHQFRDLNTPENYIALPVTSSENRKYIPMVYKDQHSIPYAAVLVVPDAKVYHFGVLHSYMHMAWTKTVCGRLKSDFRYSNTIVYNNFPWPEKPSDKHIKVIEAAAQKVLDVREQFPGSSLADLYHPLTMPPALVKAHNELDKAVDLAYRPQPFASDAKRMEFLFELYEKYTADLFSKEKKPKAAKAKKTP